MEEEAPESDLLPVQRIVLIVGAIAGVVGLAIIVLAVWCCQAARARQRAAQVQESPGTTGLLFR